MVGGVVDPSSGKLLRVGATCLTGQVANGTSVLVAEGVTGVSEVTLKGKLLRVENDSLAQWTEYRRSSLPGLARELRQRSGNVSVRQLRQLIKPCLRSN
jgi:hypothetical protein